MSDGNEKLCGDDGAGHRRIHIADNDHEIGFLPEANFFELEHDARGLFSVRTGPHIQIDIGNGNTQIAEKDIRHAIVVVLAGVEEDARQIPHFLHLFDDRRNLHEVGPSAHDVEDFHGNIH